MHKQFKKRTFSIFNRSMHNLQSKWMTTESALILPNITKPTSIVLEAQKQNISSLTQTTTACHHFKILDF